MTRGRATWLLYAVFACMAFLLNGLGSVLAPLQHELGVTRGDVAFYPSLFAVGLVVVGLGGGALVARTGRRLALGFSLAGLVAGGLLFAVPGRVPTLVGILVAGLGAALLIQLVPALLGGLHPGAPTAAVGEANGLASAVSVLAPLAVAAAISTGAGWRAGYLGAPLLVLLAVAVPLARSRLPAAPVIEARSPSAPGRPLLGRWVDLVLAVSVEFCMVFWAASAVAEWHGATPAQAPAIASLFLVGMAVSRSLATPITRRLGSGRTLILGCAALAAAGFAVFWLGPSLVPSAGGLLLTGGGVALLYPSTVTRLLAAWPAAPDRASARAALGSGVAIGAAPFVLGRLSDAAGLRQAYLIVPALLALLMLRNLRREMAPGLGAIEPLDELDHREAQPAGTQGPGHHRQERPQ